MTAPAVGPLRVRVSRERSRLRGLVVAAGAGVGLAAVAVLLAAGVVLLGDARWMALPRAMPLLVWLLAALAAAAVALLTARRARAGASEDAVARAVERERSLRAGALRGVLEVSGSGALARHAEEQLGRELDRRPGPLAPDLHRRHARYGLVAAGGAAVALTLLVAAAQSDSDGWAALASPVRAWQGTLLAPLRLVELPPAVLRGEALTVRIDAPGRRAVTVLHRVTGGGWARTRLPVAAGRAELALPALDADLVLVATDGRARSDTARIAVTDRPYLGDVVVTARFPDYLGRAPEPVPLGERVRVPRGTELRVEGGATTELRGVALADGADTLRMAVDGRRFTGRVIAERSGRWEWAAVGRGGDVPHLPAALLLDVTPDESPRVELLSPAGDSLVLPGDRVPLSLLVTDDHGLADVAVRSWRRRADGRSDPESALRLPVPEGAPQWSGDAVLDLAPRGLQPGDELRVVVTATDRSPWRQTGASRELVLRVPSLAEQRSNAREMADAAVARAVEAAQAQRALAQRTADASRARERGGASRQGGESGGGGGEASLSYESAERARTLAAEQRQLSEQVRQMQQAARDLERQLEQAGAMDEELRERLREAQRLMQEAMTPRLAEQLRQLEQASQQLDPERTQKALADLAEQQRQLREQLERSAEMLRRAALEGAMETLRDEATELAAEQRRLADSLDATPQRPSGEQRRADAGERQPGGQDPAAEVRRRTEELGREIEQLRERLARQQAEAGARRAGEAQRHAEQSAAELGRQQSSNARREQGRETAERRVEQSAAPQQSAQPQSGQPQSGQPQGAQQQGAQQQGAQQQGAQQQGAQQQGAQQQGAQAGGQAPGAGDRSGGASDAARRAAGEMEQAAEQLAAARSEQVGDWKRELTEELDRSINELTQMAREQAELGQRAQDGASAEDMRAQQSALQQGVQQTGQRLNQAGQRSTLLSQRSQQSVAQAQQQVQQAGRQVQQAAGQQAGGGTPSPAARQQAAQAMSSAAEALNQAAASLVRDRARANAAGSSTGFAEMMEQLQQMAQAQGGINQQAAGLVPGAGRQPGAAAMEQARQLGRQQRAIANQLDELGGSDRSGTADAMAEEARQLARTLESGVVDPNTINRQQRLFRRMLDAGLTLEQDEHDESGRRRGESARSGDLFVPPSGDPSGHSATRYRIPTWDELRGLSPEERRLVLEYFRRLNAESSSSAPQQAPAPPRPPER